MKKNKLQKDVEECFNMAENIITKDGFFAHSVQINLVDKNKKNVGMIVNMPPSKEQQLKFLFGLGIILGALKQVNLLVSLENIISISEAYFTKHNKDEDLSLLPLPSEAQNRREMLLAIGQNINGEYAIRQKEMFNIEVKGKRYFRFEELLNENKLKGVKSRLFNVFFDGFKLGEKDKTNPYLNLVKVNPNLSIDLAVGNGLEALGRVLNVEVESITKINY